MTNGKITVLALIKAKQGAEEQVRAELTSLVAPTRSEPGCISYDLHQDTDDKSSFMFYENWTSKAALDEHLQMPYFKALIAKADTLFAQPLDVTIWEKLS